MRSVRPPSHAQEPRRRSDDNEVPIAQEPSSQAEDANGAGRPWAGTPSPFVTMATCPAGVWSRSPFRISPSPSWAVCTIRSNRRSPCATDSTLLNVEGRRRQIKNGRSIEALTSVQWQHYSGLVSLMDVNMSQHCFIRTLRCTTIGWFPRYIPRHSCFKPLTRPRSHSLGVQLE
jgi:hypothetical protein